jgi:hypothetical protein
MLVVVAAFVANAESQKTKALDTSRSNKEV